MGEKDFRVTAVASAGSPARLAPTGLAPVERMIVSYKGTMASPIYTRLNCATAYQLLWSVSTFWTDSPGDDAWLASLKTALEPDGIRILEHTFAQPNISQFLLSTRPDVAPAQFLRLVKGRLYHLVKSHLPTPFRRNYSFRTVGSADRAVTESYVASQAVHHPMADARVQESLNELQISLPEDLSRPQHTAHGVYWYNLHVVMVNDGRWMEIDGSVLDKIHGMILAAGRAKGHRISKAGILPDHIHLTLGCSPVEAPVDVALGYMNNIAYALGMRRVFQFGLYVGTFGEYDIGAIRAALAGNHSLHWDKPGGGEARGGFVR